MIDTSTIGIPDEIHDCDADEPLPLAPLEDWNERS